MTRRLLNLLTTLSLLVCVAAAAEWAFNRRSIHGWTVSAPYGFGLVRWRPGDVYLGLASYLRPPQPGDYEAWMQTREWAVLWRTEVITNPPGPSPRPGWASAQAVHTWGAIGGSPMSAG